MIDHSSITRTTASGYFKEETQTWVGPDFRLRAPRTQELGALKVVGWLPDLNAYPGGVFVMKISANGNLVATEKVTTPGEFSFGAELSPDADVIQITASQRSMQGGDLRPLSWILLSVTFNRKKVEQTK